MRARNSVYVFVVVLFGLIRSATTTLEHVWLKEVTRSQIDKRTHGDTHFPNELAFHLRRRLENLTLNLRRNQDINPNADFYFAQKMNDGRTVLVKSPNLGTEDESYYQDIENGAFITVRCVKQSNKQCERIINGHIRIRDTAYEILLASNNHKSRNLEVTGRLGKRYVLKNMPFIQRDVSAEIKDAVHVKEEDTKQELKAFLRRFERQDKEYQVPSTEAMLSTRNVSSFHNRGAIDEIRQLKKTYYVKVAVMIDSGLWDMYSSMEPKLNPLLKRRDTMRNIRRSFSHIMNGVNLIYKGIDDTSISIDVILTDFITFKDNAFPHKTSNVEKINGTKYIKAEKYINDLKRWDKTEGVKNEKVYDHGMLFTRYKMYGDSPDHYLLGGSPTEGVCTTGKKVSVVEARGMFWTVFTAAHELGHNLGADHDGENFAKECKADDNFIMTSKLPDINIISSSRNPWVFSNCSVKTFKDSLKYRDCVKVRGSLFDINEYLQDLTLEPGVAYNVTEQCRLLIGRNSKFCKTAPADVCHKMRCTDPATGECMRKYHGAAKGTECGQNKWCVEARCVPKPPGV